jgi:hypothetical protein
MYVPEEAVDIPTDTHTGPTIDHAAADRRDEINAEVPVRQPAAAASTPRAPRVTEPAKPAASTNGNGHRTDEQWRIWLDKLRAAVGVVHTLAEVEEIGERDTVGTALATGPAFVQREISAILADGYARFVKPPTIDNAPPEVLEGLGAGTSRTHPMAPEALRRAAESGAFSDHPDGGPRIAGEHLVGAG